MPIYLQEIHICSQHVKNWERVNRICYKSLYWLTVEMKDSARRLEGFIASCSSCVDTEIQKYVLEEKQSLKEGKHR